MKYSVELYEKFNKHTHGNYIKTLGVFDSENDAWAFMQEHEGEISDNEVLDIYELEGA